MKTKLRRILTKPQLVKLRAKQWRAVEVRPKRAEKLVDVLVGARQHKHSVEEKVAALVELLVGLEDETGANLCIAKASRRAQLHAFRYSQAFCDSFSEFIDTKLEGATHR